MASRNYSRMISFKIESDKNDSESNVDFEDRSLFNIKRTLEDRRGTDNSQRLLLQHQDSLKKKVMRKNTAVPSNALLSPIKDKRSGKDFSFYLPKLKKKAPNYREVIKKTRFENEWPAIDAPPVHYNSDEKHDSYWELVAKEVLFGNKNMMRIYT
ncbi:unnamed protein product [Moneuplotes crassus]|uniref:Uncharacterized protein n=1 Tax=Euplotes crassus TaxID=5936 RepID=A0AAD1X237_EUPCR|nr:unnamed protein product [Moneuplotes crassus]